MKSVLSQSITAAIAAALAVSFTALPALADEQQVLFAADTSTYKIDLYNISGSLVTSFGDASLNLPQGIAQGAGGVIYVGGNQGYVEKYSSTGAYLGVFANPNNSSAIQGVATDSSGNVYVTNGRSVYKYNSAGTLLHSYNEPGTVNNLIGVGLNNSGDVFATGDGPAGFKLYEFNSSLNPIGSFVIPAPSFDPYSVALTNDGYAFTTDAAYGVSHQINLTTGIGTTFSAGSAAYAVAVDSAGLYAPSSDLFFSTFPGIVETDESGNVINTFNLNGNRPMSIAFGYYGTPKAPEPGALALLLGAGATGACALLRRRRTMKLRSVK